MTEARRPHDALIPDCREIAELLTLSLLRDDRGEPEAISMVTKPIGG